ncbi:MAG TPA: hypothetical protein VFW63_02125 [Acidimicrobiales bacterium]|nr:hypothetical protein [Acidimicrobiales bacterium]
MLLVGTADGLLDLALDGTEERRTLVGADVVAVSGDWAVAGGWLMALELGRPVDLPASLAPRCVLALPGGRALVGTSDARLLEVGGPDGVRRDAAFDGVPGRARWSTPWGGPPDLRSLAVAGDRLYASVHVGGVWRRDATGWAQVVAAERDGHQVAASGTTVVVAAAVGVGQSDDGGDTWHWSDAGLHGPYCRAVAIADGWVLASASPGPGATEGAVYRRPLREPRAPFTRCGGGGEGLPTSFARNVDTSELAASGALAAVGTPEGDVHLSDDAGATWRRVAVALPGVRCVGFTS